MPTLEELVRGSDTSDEIVRAAEIARGEWEKIRVSLSLCGDAGEFRGEDFMLGIISGDAIARNPAGSPTKSVSLHSPTYYPMYLVANLLAFSEKFPEKGYGTTEALYVYVELVTKAAARLGLEETWGWVSPAATRTRERAGPRRRGSRSRAPRFAKCSFRKGRGAATGIFTGLPLRETFGRYNDRFVLWRDRPEVRFEGDKVRRVRKALHRLVRDAGAARPLRTGVSALRAPLRWRCCKVRTRLFREPSFQARGVREMFINLRLRGKRRYAS